MSKDNRVKNIDTNFTKTIPHTNINSKTNTKQETLFLSLTHTHTNYTQLDKHNICSSTRRNQSRFPVFFSFRRYIQTLHTQTLSLSFFTHYYCHQFLPYNPIALTPQN
ncbi:hypothetical protein QVD17_30399 [Tagetes erecta]|uniref:Uncharacterized protein n=1 Tax=Tagetes erecta TaxID=13708 RepID=A0AAD8K1G5_TARER|nr:hypothetical protein QVD17_30399 [Tagetes erecta]